MGGRSNISMSAHFHIPPRWPDRKARPPAAPDDRNPNCRGYRRCARAFAAVQLQKIRPHHVHQRLDTGIVQLHDQGHNLQAAAHKAIGQGPRLFKFKLRGELDIVSPSAIDRARSLAASMAAGLVSPQIFTAMVRVVGWAWPRNLKSSKPLKPLKCRLWAMSRAACAVGCSRNRPADHQYILAPASRASAGPITRRWSPSAAPSGRMPGTTSGKSGPSAWRSRAPCAEHTLIASHSCARLAGAALRRLPAARPRDGKPVAQAGQHVTAITRVRARCFWRCRPRRASSPPHLGHAHSGPTRRARLLHGSACHGVGDVVIFQVKKPAGHVHAGHPRRAMGAENSSLLQSADMGGARAADKRAEANRLYQGDVDGVHSSRRAACET